MKERIIEGERRERGERNREREEGGVLVFSRDGGQGNRESEEKKRTERKRKIERKRSSFLSNSILL